MARPDLECVAADRPGRGCAAVARVHRWDRLPTLAAAAMAIALPQVLDSKVHRAILTARARVGWVRPMVPVPECVAAVTMIGGTVTTTMIAGRAPDAAAHHRAAPIATALILI